MVAFMRVRFCAIAAAAVGAWTETPRVMVAWSGAILVSPKAERFRVVARNTASISPGVGHRRGGGASQAGRRRGSGRSASWRQSPWECCRAHIGAEALNPS